MNNLKLKAQKSGNGLTFIEIAITLLLLSTLLSNVLFTYSYSNMSLQINIEDYIAQNSALELLEQICSLPYQHIPVGTFSNDQIKDKLFINSSSKISFHISNIPNIEREIEIKEIKKPNKKPIKIIEARIKVIKSKIKQSKENNVNIKKITLKTLVAEE